MGCYEISLCDTIGVGVPGQARAMVRAVAAAIPRKKIAIHFHDTHGRALANILACFEEDISVVDSAIGGLGGCPYAPRSEERRVGKGGVSTCRSRWSAYH